MNCMKSYRERLKNQAIRNEIDKANDAWFKNVDFAIAYTLHNLFGFGAGRIKKFFKLCRATHKEMMERYRSDGDDSHYWVMEKRLKDGGIDVEKIIAELDAEDEVSE